MNLKHKISILLQKKFFVQLANALGLTDTVLNLYWKKMDSASRGIIASSGIMEPPTTVYLEATMKCNLHCKICHQEARRGENCDMTTEQMYKVIDRIKEAGIPIIQLTGGEMFLRKDIIDIIRYIDSKEITLKINTNSTVITRKQIEALRGFKHFECYGTSIDGSRSVHDEARGQQGAYSKSCSVLRSLGKTHFQKMICFTMTPHNRECIENVIELADECGMDRVLFLSEMYATESDIQRSREILSLKNEDSIFIRSKTMDNYYPDLMVKIHNRIKSLRKKYSVLFPIYPIIANNRPKEFYGRKLSCSLFCSAFNTLIIANNGDVRICQFISKPLGNLLTQSIDEIWNCEAIRNMRMKILENEKMLPICATCDCVEEVK